MYAILRIDRLTGFFAKKLPETTRIGEEALLPTAFPHFRSAVAELTIGATEREESRYD